MNPIATTLTDRYIAAAMRTVPEAQREDLAAELRGSIDDQIEARIGEGEDPEGAERAVLTDLGDPDKLAAGYTERPLWLIGPRYFLDWWRLFKLLLWIVPVCAAFGVSFALVLEGATIGEIVGAVVPVLISVVVHLGFWTVLVFAMVERTTTRDRKDPLVPWSVDQLPETRLRGAGFSEMVATLVYLVAAAGAILWDQFIGFVPTEPGLSFLDPGLWPVWICALFVVMAVEGALAIAVYAARRWTIGLAVVNGLLNVLVVVPALWLLAQDALINQEFFQTIIGGTDGDEVQSIVTVVTGFAMVGIAIWDTVDAALKAVRARRG